MWYIKKGEASYTFSSWSGAVQFCGSVGIDVGKIHKAGVTDVVKKIKKRCKVNGQAGR